MSDIRATAGPFTLVLPPNGRATLFEADGSGVDRECPWGVGHFEALTQFAGEVIRLSAMINSMHESRNQIPVRSISETRRMLRVVIAELTEVAAAMDRAGENDRTLLCGAQRRINLLNKKINCYRSGGRDWQ